MTRARSLRRSLVGATASAVLAAVSALGAFPTPAAAGGSDFVNMANGYRTSNGLSPVSVHAQVDQIAVERAHQLVANGELGHDFAYVQRRFADLGICWRGFGEIVAYNGSGDYSRYGEQWWNSPVHHDIMMGDYTHAGGAREQSGSRWYGVMIFVKLCDGATAPGTFSDIGGSFSGYQIEWLADQGIVAGCTPTRFCPTRTVRRAEMASFLKRAMALPWPQHDYYADDSSSIHEPDINAVTEAHVAGGCYPIRYCPRAYINRAEMASFLARALHLPPATADHFWDDNGSMHEGAINQIAEAGIAGGCGDGRYCPGWGVSREQMAAFLERSFR